METICENLSAYYYQNHDRYYLGNSEKQWQICVRASNGKTVSVLFDDKQEIDDLPPSEVIQLIKDRINSFWIMTDKQQRLSAIQWFEENAEQIDSGWAKKQIEHLKQKIGRLEYLVIE